MNTKWTYLFDELDAAEVASGDWDSVRGLLGGKGANLADMTRLGIPVPPGFTVTTDACNAYLEGGERFPEDCWEQTIAALEALETATGKRFGDRDNPLLVSCRSGAKFSMPGMMDTILNLGLNDEVAEGMIELTGDARFVYDSYRRLVQMFGSVVLEAPDHEFEKVIEARRIAAGAASDSDLGADDWRDIVGQFKEIVGRHSADGFPEDPRRQLRLAVEAVFKSWNGKRAIDYRQAADIPHDLGTAVNIVVMVFGNLGEGCATGVAMSRNASNGEPELEGDFLINAQGEDVVAGIRITERIAELKQKMPTLYEEFEHIARTLENHYRNMQDMEFTIERGKLWLLQTRDGKRTAQAEVRIAADMVAEGLINKREAVSRVSPDQVGTFLHPQLDPEAVRNSTALGVGLNVSPGAAVGKVAFDADTTERWGKENGLPVIMVRPETKPDDVHGMLAARGIVTSRGGRTSHAALVARQFGKPAVVGVEAMQIDLDSRRMRIGETTVAEGDFVSIDGSTGEIYAGELQTVVPDFENPYLLQILDWADEIRRLEVWGNADYPADAERARSYGAQGLGLVRTEHMFFEAERLPIVQHMILTDREDQRLAAIDQLLPMQRSDFEGLFLAMDGLPVVIRLLDPPLHEFLPAHEDLILELTDLKLRLRQCGDLGQLDELLGRIAEKQHLLDRVETLREANPMLGTRGVRLGLQIPALTTMQVRAIFEAACNATSKGATVLPEIMVPLTAHVNELREQREIAESVAAKVMEERSTTIDYKFGTMIEIPRAALTAGQIAEMAQFFSFGTNDLTQTTFGISRDDAESGFLMTYLERGILPENPFETLDQQGVGRLLQIGVDLGRAQRPDLVVGICGEHGGDPATIEFCHRIGLDYVSCSPFRVPVARLAAAHAAMADSS